MNIERILGLAVSSAQRTVVSGRGQVVDLDVVSHVGGVHGLVAACRAGPPTTSRHFAHETLHLDTVI
jgi:hypothetical protein